MDIRKYQAGNGDIPFDAWFEKIRDLRAKAKILIRLKRVEEGNFGDSKSLGDGVSEMRIPEGQGYRVYYGQTQNKIVILLCGGNKSSQQKDIALAKKYWSNYYEDS
jgi:putative addiction module killer protein